MLNHGLTYIGTLRSNKREIPPLLHQCFQVQESEFVFGGPDKQITLCAYAAKPRKTIHMITTLHHDKKIPVSDNDKRKPAVIFDYNHTKAGVDTLDQMCRMYSARSTTKRWPLVCETKDFQNLLDVAGINAQTVFDEAHPSGQTFDEKTDDASF